MQDSFKHGMLEVMREVATMLVEKNNKYGNSALVPKRIFSRADSVEQLKVRIDDKLSRIATSDPKDTEDAELDLLGYLVLLRMARNAEKKSYSK